MKASVVMDEIREIRDANSLRHLTTTTEERRKEADESLKWFIKAMGRQVKVVGGEGE